MALRWGLLSTARINDKLLAGARSTDEAEVVAVASRDGDRAPGVRRRARDRARARLLRRAARGSRASTPSTSRCPTPCTRRGRCGRSRPASTSCARSRTRGGPTRPRRRSTRAEAAGLVLAEAFMWRHNPQTRRLRTLVEEGAIGDPAARPRRVLVPALRPRQRAHRRRPRRRRADGRRLLLRERCAPARRRRAGARLRRAGGRRRRGRHRLRRHAALPGRGPRAVRLRLHGRRPRRARGDRGRRLRCSSTTPGTASSR